MIQALTFALLVLSLTPVVLAQRLTHPAEFNQLLGDGHYLEAEAFARKMLASAEASGGPETTDVAIALDLLIEVHAYGEKPSDPEPAALAVRALRLKQKLFGSDHPEYALTTRLYANYLLRTGHFREAQPLYEEAIGIEEKEPNHDVNQLRHIWLAYATLLRDMGDYAAAKSYLERALSMCQNRYGFASWGVAMSLDELGTVAREMGEDAAAKDYFTRSLIAFEQKAGRGHAGSVDALIHLGSLLVSAGEPRQGSKLLEEALALRQTTHAADHMDIGLILESLAIAHANLREYQEAKPLFERAVYIIEKNYGPNHPRLAAALDRFALFLALIGDTEAAARQALRAEQIGRDHLSATIRGLPERQALLFAAARAQGLNTAVMLASERAPESVKAVLDAVIRSRALVFDELAARNRVAADSGDPEVGRLSRELTAAREHLSNTVIRAPGPSAGVSGDGYAAAVNRAHEEKERAERALAAKSAVFREDLVTRHIGLDEVAAALSPGEAVVSFVRYGGRLSAQYTPRYTPGYAAFVLKGGESVPAVIRIGDASEIEELVSALREQVASEAAAPEVSPKRSEAAYRAAGLKLRRRIWDPLAPFVSGMKRVFIVPDGALYLVNFAALPVGSAGYLIERGALIHYLSTERDLIHADASRVAPSKGLLALGDPAFNRRIGPAQNRLLASSHTFRGAPPGCVDFQGMRFDPLPGSGREVDEIAAIWKKSEERTGFNDVLELKGAGASESAFKETASGRRVLHIAAHGFFLGENCRTARTGKGAVKLDNPLLYSGLALAGANQRRAGRADEEDGIMTAEEIAALDLGGVEWAVLSGCNTGVGELSTGEGVFGLRRAFQLAGARTVIMSLWPVDDQAARHWMTALYRKRLLSHMDTARSIREASVDQLRHRRAAGQSSHPFYWASFVATGDWR